MTSDLKKKIKNFSPWTSKSGAHPPLFVTILTLYSIPGHYSPEITTSIGLSLLMALTIYFHFAALAEVCILDFS